MKQLEGYKLIELTDDKIVQEKRLGETGMIRVIGNPNPPEKEQQECINRIAKILFGGYQRDMLANQEKTGA